jgi:hypothetical protein
MHTHVQNTHACLHTYTHACTHAYIHTSRGCWEEQKTSKCHTWVDKAPQSCRNNPYGGRTKTCALVLRETICWQPPRQLLATPPAETAPYVGRKKTSRCGRISTSREVENTPKYSQTSTVHMFSECSPMRKQLRIATLCYAAYIWRILSYEGACAVGQWAGGRRADGHLPVGYLLTEIRMHLQNRSRRMFQASMILMLQHLPHLVIATQCGACGRVC